MSNTVWNRKSAGELQTFLANKIILPGSEDYKASYQGWAATDNRPEMICRCEHTEDVRAGVILAQKLGLKISVRGGGHDWQGRSFIHGGLVIDLTRLDSIVIDKDARVAIIGGGVKTIALTTAAGEVGLVQVTGTSGEVGMAGFTMGGGYGLTSPSHGLGADNLLAAEVVLADGRVVQATPTENPDLLWALQGGGGNFGVVTSLHIRLYPAKPFIAGRIMFDLSESVTILKGYNELIKSAPDELYVMVQAMEGPNGKTTLMIAPNWYGDPEEGRRQIEPFRRLGTPLFEQLSDVTLKSLLESFAPFIVNGRRIYAKTRWLSELRPEIISGIAEAINNRTSPLSVIGLLQIHGAATRVAIDDTAFGLRDQHFILLIGAEWTVEDETDSEKHKRWVDNLFELTAPFAIPGGYANLLGNDDIEQIQHAHGTNLPRLLQIKNKYDSNDIFHGVPLARSVAD